MAYVPGWKAVGDLIQRLDDLETTVGCGKVIPAPWEPFYKECSCFRDAQAYAWARRRLQSPTHFAVDLAFFPENNKQPCSARGHANWLMLCAEGHESEVTGKLMLTEALELWDIHETQWLEQSLTNAAALGMETSIDALHQLARRARDILKNVVPIDDEVFRSSDLAPAAHRSQGFDKELLHMDGWTQDPGTIYLPVGGRIHSLASEILLLDLHKVSLLRGRRLIRSVDWVKVTLIYLFEGALIFDISGEPPLVLSGFKQPESALKIAQECYRAATERMLQALATKVTRSNP